MASYFNEIQVIKAIVLHLSKIDSNIYLFICLFVYLFIFSQRDKTDT